MNPLPLSNPATYSTFAVRRRLHEAGWRVRNAIQRPSVLVAGEYFAGNLGDWTMGQAFLGEARQAGIRSGLTGYARAASSAPSVIMGGGELGDRSHFERAIRMAGAPERVVACGVNPVYTFDRLPSELLGQIARMPYLSVRSETGAEQMRSVLSRPDIEVNPDPAFCFMPPGPPPGEVPRRLAVSLMPFYLSVQNRKVFAADQTLKTIVADPEFSVQIDQAGEYYIDMMRHLIAQALSDGWEVVNIPFSEVDAMFAQTILRDLPVKRIPYSRNPARVLESLQSCRRIVATRFHAHLFGLMAKVPVVSIAYANKCTQLWKDLGLDADRQITRRDVCRDPRGCADRLAGDEGARLSAEQRSALAQGARESIQKAFKAVDS